LLKIGLTGGIASGKTTVSKLLAARGVPVIDADVLGWRTYEPGTQTFAQVVAAFGDDLVAEDGTINRKVLGGKVFGRPDEMKRLTDIVWPGIRVLATEELKRLEGAGEQVALLEAAVLIEADWLDLVDEVWVTVVDPAVARERLMARNGWSAEEADARINSQLTNEQRLVHAQVVITNNGSLEDLERQVEEAWSAVEARSYEPARLTEKQT
jgi:phosphopantetheine adenylyltransferase/dephospho-CoA kinase